MDRRLELHDILCSVLGSPNVYYQPPEGLKLSYPCIVYNLEKIESKFSNNKPYIHNRRYSVTVIDRDPDTSVMSRIVDLPMISHDRQFVNDNLYHNVFTLYY